MNFDKIMPRHSQVLFQIIDETEQKRDNVVLISKQPDCIKGKATACGPECQEVSLNKIYYLPRVFEKANLSGAAWVLIDEKQVLGELNE
jgi:hypothetical protein